VHTVRDHDILSLRILMHDIQLPFRLCSLCDAPLCLSAVKGKLTYILSFKTNLLVLLFVADASPVADCCRLVFNMFVCVLRQIESWQLSLVSDMFIMFRLNRGSTRLMSTSEKRQEKIIWKRPLRW